MYNMIMIRGEIECERRMRVMRQLHPVEFQRAVHASGRDIVCVLPEPDAGGHGGVVLEDLQLGPLLAEVHTDVGSGHGEVGSALVEAEVLDLVPLVELDGLEVL